jgi:hypothetical protein
MVGGSAIAGISKKTVVGGGDWARNAGANMTSNKARASVSRRINSSPSD